jgi:predicted phage tail protein
LAIKPNLILNPMKKIQLIIISIAIATAGLFVSCDFPSNKIESSQLSESEAERKKDITRSEVEREIQKFRIEMAGKIMENNRSVADIKRQINSGDMSVRVTQEARIIGLQSENRVMKRIMDNYSDLSRHNWDNFKKEYTDDMESLGNSLKNFFENSDVAK